MHAQSCLTLCTARTVAHQAPLSMGLSRQEYWSGLPFSTSGDLPDTGIEPVFPQVPACRQILYSCKQETSLKVSVEAVSISETLGPLSSLSRQTCYILQYFQKTHASVYNTVWKLLYRLALNTWKFTEKNETL